jgi:serine/threonine protein phosphatase 1
MALGAKPIERIYAIGDIHGCLGHLKLLLEKIQPDFSHHRLVFIGDYIDRGPDSKGVIDFIINLKKKFTPERIICLRGNHEYMFLEYLRGENKPRFLLNGGSNTVVSYWGQRGDRTESDLPSPHWEFFERLQLLYETEDYIFVHGGLKPGVPLPEQKEEDLLWIREEFIFSPEDFGRPVIFGHTPFRAPLVQPNKIGIDTGAVYGNKLTCVSLPEKIFFSVP